MSWRRENSIDIKEKPKWSLMMQALVQAPKWAKSKATQSDYHLEEVKTKEYLTKIWKLVVKFENKLF